MLKKLLIAGVDYQPFGSWPKLSQSDDGVSWDEASVPFEVGDAPTAITNDGTTVAVANGRGYLSITSDMVNFETVEVSDGFGITGMMFQGGDWLVIGQQMYPDAYGPYPAKSQVAQIFKSSSALGPWEMVWTSSSNDSAFYQIKFFQNGPISASQISPVWVTCGSKSGDQASAWYSLDYGSTWSEVYIPAGVGRLTSLELVSIGATDYWYWGSNGNLYRSETLSSTEWSEISVNATDTILDMFHYNGKLLVAAGDRIYISDDGFYLRSWDQPGYFFDRVSCVIGNGDPRWIAFGRSTLTQYTFWQSTDLSTWTAGNNGIHVTSSTIYSEPPPE